MNHHSNEGNFEILVKMVCFRRKLLADFRESPRRISPVLYCLNCPLRKLLHDDSVISVKLYSNSFLSFFSIIYKNIFYPL